jgi:adenylate cyclase
MGKEIERKFLVKGDSWRGPGRGILVRQGHLSTDPERVVRVRTAGKRGYVTIKGKGQGLTRPEYEYGIPPREAAEILDTLCVGSIIEKTRYHVEYEGRTWEIDEFHGDNQGLVIAELELEREDEDFEIPEWIGEEVSDDPRYLNVNLALHPYNQWRGEKEKG